MTIVANVGKLIILPETVLFFQTILDSRIQTKMTAKRSTNFIASEKDCSILFFRNL